MVLEVPKLPEKPEPADLIHCIFTPVLEICEQLKPAKGLTDPSEAARYWTDDVWRWWRQVGGNLRRAEAVDFPPDLRSCLDFLATVRRNTRRKCRSLGDVSVYLAARLDKLTEAAHRGWTAAKFGGIVPAAETEPELDGAANCGVSGEEATPQQPNSAGQSDTENDTEKNPKKVRRRLNDAAHNCIRRFKTARKKDASTTMKSVVEDYVDENGGSVSGILKRLEANPEEWKRLPQNRHQTDT